MILTIVFCALIFGAFLVYLFQIQKLKKNNQLVEKRRYIEQRPTAVSTFGVLGTFVGISIGLWHFNTQDINASIPELLDGLKTAFFTSLTGMVCSLFLSRKVDTIYDNLEAEQKKEKEHNRITDIENAAGLIVKAVESMSQQSKTDSDSMRKAIEDLCKQSVTYQQDNLAKQDIIIGSLDDVKDSVNIIRSERFPEINSNLYTINTSITEANGQVKDGLGKLERCLAELSSVLHKEVVDIEQKMTQTNKLLTSKFDEFSELLKKSNTEALVEVMKEVTKEFQKQMNELIGRLVKENFDRLNKSVEQLNTWQIENKEMIQSLTNQYKQMQTQFAETGTTLTKVGEDTKGLVSDGGKLSQIVGALNRVMIEDEKFVQIASNLSSTADLSKQNMEAFQESTNKLNEWVKKQRNFVDGVQELIAKLEEISKLKDYSDEFWKGQKQGMAESMNALKQGSLTLNTQLKSLDQQFYNRLNATLAELDTCIQAMVNGRR